MTQHVLLLAVAPPLLVLARRGRGSGSRCRSASAGGREGVARSPWPARCASRALSPIRCCAGRSSTRRSSSGTSPRCTTRRCATARPRARARALLRHGPAVLGRGVRLAAVARAPHWLARRVRHDRACSSAGSRARARVRAVAALSAYARSPHRPGRALRARRPAARRRHDVGAGLARVHRRDHRLRLPVARARGVSNSASASPAEAERSVMHTFVASHFLAGSILTLVLPVGLLVVRRHLLGCPAAPPFGGCAERARSNDGAGRRLLGRFGSPRRRRRDPRRRSAWAPAAER